MLGVVMVHASCLRTWEIEVGRPPRVIGKTGLHREFQASQSYIVRPCLNNQKQRKNQKRNPRPQALPPSDGDPEY